MGAEDDAWPGTDDRGCARAQSAAAPARRCPSAESRGTSLIVAPNRGESMPRLSPRGARRRRTLPSS
jgi:hypothetical protein